MEKSKLLAVKNEKKAKQPRFIRQDIHKKKRLDEVWRKPRGSDSKKRLRMQKRVIVSTGYGSPKELRGMDKEGREIVNVSSLSALENIDPKKQSLIISGKIGMKRRLEILRKATEMKLEILNIINPSEYIKTKEEAFKSKKKEKEEKASKKTEKVKESKADKKETKKDSIEDTLSEEEKKKIEKKEIDKLLTKKE